MQSRKLPLSSNPEWVALPSDPNTPFTPEQDAAFYSPNATRILRDMVLAASRDAAFMSRLATTHAAASPHLHDTPNGQRVLETADV